MKKGFKDIIEGYRLFRQKYAIGDHSVMSYLSAYGQKPEIMLVACCDARVDPALILQCEPGDLFVVRNVANIVPPYEQDEALHGTSAALEFGVCVLNVAHLILLGHSQCSGVAAMINNQCLTNKDFIKRWVASIKLPEATIKQVNQDECAKLALTFSYKNCLTFPWIKEKVEQEALMIHQWFFDIEKGQIFTYSEIYGVYQALDS